MGTQHLIPHNQNWFRLFGIKCCVPIFLIVLPVVSFANENACVLCHQQLKGHPYEYLGHNYADWKKSIHATAGVNCSACHGGDPKSSDPVKAHQGVLPSKDKKSSIHFQKVPETCGQCHQAEYKEFQKSIHYKTLLRNGKGPNCLTCHGSMATTILTYADLDKTCSLCHGKPSQAAKALSLIGSIKNLLTLYQKKHPSQQKELELFQGRYKEIQRKWHSFDIVKVLEESETLIKDIKEVMEK